MRNRFRQRINPRSAEFAAAVVGAGSRGKGVTKSSAYVGGPAPWTRVYSPLQISALTKSAELTSTAKYVTAASAANGPAMFRREGAAVLIEGSAMTQPYGNLNTGTAGIAAGAWASTTIALQVYWHRLNTSSKIVLRVGTNTGNYVRYVWDAASNMLAEGYNTLLAWTGEPVGAGNSPAGQQAFATAFSRLDGWLVGAGSFSFATDPINYIAIEVDGMRGPIHHSFVWIEGLYVGGRDKPRVTLGFDIQTSGLDLAKSTMDKYGLLGYAAVPTANANPSQPNFLWTAADVARLQSLQQSGWNIIQHSVSHNPLGNYSDDGMIQAEFEGCRSQIVQIGCDEGADFVALANNSNSNRVVAIAARSGVKWMRGTGPLLRSSGLVGDANPLLQGCMSISNNADATRAMQFVTLLKNYGASGHMYTHAVQTDAVQAGDGSGINIGLTAFDAICAYLASEVSAGNIDVVTPYSFANAQSWPQIRSVLGMPSRLAITPLASPYSHINSGYEPIVLMVSGGTVSAIEYSKDGSTFDSTGQTSGQFFVSPGDRLRITYSVAPAIIQAKVVLS